MFESPMPGKLESIDFLDEISGTKPEIRPHITFTRTKWFISESVPKLMHKCENCEIELKRRTWAKFNVESQGWWVRDTSATESNVMRTPSRTRSRPEIC
jgi:hypothetical protein